MQIITYFNYYCVSCDLIAASRFNIKSFDFLKFVTNYSFLLLLMHLFVQNEQLIKFFCFKNKCLSIYH